MPITGRMILVSGHAGAGKTTLIGAALNELPQLTYLTTYTTRPRRPGEEQTHEYVFVSGKDYEARRLKSADWDHTEYGGYYYGADVQDTKDKMAAGKHVICSIVPDGLVLGDMKRRYGVEPVTIWIDVLPETARRRIADDAVRTARKEDEFAHRLFRYTFQPTGELEADCHEFGQRLKKLLSYSP